MVSSFLFFFFFGQGECRQVDPLRSRSSEEHTCADVETFDIVNLIFPWGRTTAIRIPAYFRRCFGGFRITQSVTNGGFKIYRACRKFVFLTSRGRPIYPSFSFREFLAEFKVDSSLREIRSKPIAWAQLFNFQLGN